MDGQPVLKPSHFYNADLNVDVPGDGTIFTSERNISRRIAIMRNSNGTIHKISPGYGIVTKWDTLYYKNKMYRLDEYAVLDYPKGWYWNGDSIRRNKKKQLIIQKLDNLITHH